MVELVVTTGRHKDRRIQIHPGENVTVGRAPHGVDWVLDEAGVANRHAAFENRRGVVWVTDLHSGSGTRINNERIHPGEPVPLRPDDVVRLGNAKLQVASARSQVVTDPTGDRQRLSESGRMVFVDGEPRSDWLIRRRFDEPESGSIPSVVAASADPVAQAQLQAQLEALYAMGDVVHAEQDPVRIATLVADRMKAVVRASRSAILLVDEETGNLGDVVVRTDKAEVDELPVSRTIVEETLRQGTSLLSTDAGTDPRFAGGASIIVQGIRSVMSAPVRTHNRVIGVIYADRLISDRAFAESDLHLLAAAGKQVVIAMERARLIVDLEQLFMGSIKTLVASIEAKDEYTRGHSERVTRYALAVAGQLQLSAQEQAVLELAGVLHDVGKIGVPESLLNKPGRLTAEEFAIVKQHPQRGADIIENIPKINRIVDFDAVFSGVLHHHERFDGKGYPTGLAGHTIPKTARILAVADTFDAMTSSRSYRSARDAQTALQELSEHRGTQFDPVCVDAFVAVAESGGLGSASLPQWRFLK